MTIPTRIRETIETCARDSHAGNIHFGEVVGALTRAGVESYHADFRTGAITYYLPDGETLDVPLHTPGLPLAERFSAEAMQAAVRGAQAGRVKFPEFLTLSLQAGCIGYIVWIAGRHVSYFGRRGETHVERFPGAM